MYNLSETRPYLTELEKEQLRLDVLGMPAGTQSYNVSCPRCGQAGSFGVHKDHIKVQYKCHRIKCGVVGVVFFTSFQRDTVADINKNKKKEKPLKPFVGELSSLDDATYKHLEDKYELPKEAVDHNGFKLDAINGRICMPLLNVLGYQIGDVCKKLPDSKYEGPKSVNYMSTRDPFKLHFPKQWGKAPFYDWSAFPSVVLVEDILSATKLVKYMPSCALLGTYMSKEQATMLSKHYKHLIIMLDPDAANKSLKIKRSYSALFTTVRVVCLDKDPKDTPYKDLDTIMGRLLGNKSYE